MRKREYRFQDQSGSTRSSLDRLYLLPKLGKLQYIRGTQYRHPANPATRTVVYVRGEKGYMRFNCFCWGYGGEGPHGLRRLFDALRIPQSIATHVAHDIKSPDMKTPGECWRITCGEDFESFTLKVYEDGQLVQHNAYELASSPQPVQRQLALA